MQDSILEVVNFIHVLMFFNENVQRILRFFEFVNFISKDILFDKLRIGMSSQKNWF